MRSAGQRPAAGVGARRGPLLARVLRLRSKVHRPGIPQHYSRRSSGAYGRAGAAAVDRGVQGDRRRGHVAGGFSTLARDWRAVRERSEHHSRVHDHQHVCEAVGRVGRHLPRAAGSSGGARDRAPLGETAASHQFDMIDRAIPAVLLLATLGLAGPHDHGQDGLHGVDALLRVYDEILDARFDQARADLPHACGPAPHEACDVLAATATWWRILLDPQDRALDEQFSREVDRAIASNEAWAAREPDSAEAHFYTGAAYAARVQWRVLRDEKLSAARDGKRIKQALERAIALDPDLEDAHFGIGLYEYYADIAPATAKVLRFLLMLPGGNRTEGLSQMRRARSEGKLMRGEADYQLQIIYLWYERRPDIAVQLLASLRDRFPGNPLFRAQLADVEDRYQHDITASLATWRELLADARDQRVQEAALAEAQARLGIARQLEALAESDRALEQLRAVLEARPAAPAGAMASAYLGLGEAEDRLGHHDAAIAAYRQAVTASPSLDPQEIRARATERMKKTPDATRAEA